MDYLFHNDLRSILEDIDALKPNYEQLGVYLGIRGSDLNTIKQENYSNIWGCLKSVIVMWLKRNTISSEKPNRRILVEAIRKINIDFASRLEREYEKGLFLCTCRCFIKLKYRNYTKHGSPLMNHACSM